MRHNNLISTHIVCPESIQAIQGAIGTVIEAVNHVVSIPAGGSSSHAMQHSRAFVAVRPPGHHCGEDTPSGFCFVNNVAIGAAHGSFIFMRETQYSDASPSTSQTRYQSRCDL